MNENDDKSIPVVIFAIIVLAYIYYNGSSDKNDLTTNKVYTTGRIIKAYPVIGYFNFDYYYEFNNKKYYATNSGSKNQKNNMSKYFIVKLSIQNPENSELLINLPICDTTLFPSRNGWKKIPKKALCSQLPLE